VAPKDLPAFIAQAGQMVPSAKPLDSHRSGHQVPPFATVNVSFNSIRTQNNEI
jgi:hypothetical protein